MDNQNKVLIVGAAALGALAFALKGVKAAPKPASLTGKVTNKSGAAIAGVDVTVTGITKPAETGADGRYAITGLTSGKKVTVKFNQEPYIGQTFTDWGPLKEGVNELSCTLREEEEESPVTGGLAGIVRANQSGGAAIAGATVALSGPKTETITTPPGGTFSFTGLVEGNYTLNCSAAGFDSRQYGPYYISEDTVKTVEIILPTSPVQGPSMTGRVVKKGVTPLAAIVGANIHISQEASERDATSGTDGYYTVTGLKLGAAHLVYHAAGYVNVERTITIVAGTNPQPVVELELGAPEFVCIYNAEHVFYTQAELNTHYLSAHSSINFSIHGLVTDMEDQPIPDVFITLSSGLTGRTNAVGVYSFSCPLPNNSPISLTFEKLGYYTEIWQNYAGGGGLQVDIKMRLAGVPDGYEPTISNKVAPDDISTGEANAYGCRINFKPSGAGGVFYNYCEATIYITPTVENTSLDGVTPVTNVGTSTMIILAQKDWYWIEGAAPYRDISNTAMLQWVYDRHSHEKIFLSWLVSGRYSVSVRLKLRLYTDDTYQHWYSVGTFTYSLKATQLNAIMPPTPQVVVSRPNGGIYSSNLPVAWNSQDAAMVIEARAIGDGSFFVGGSELPPSGSISFSLEDMARMGDYYNGSYQVRVITGGPAVAEMALDASGFLGPDIPGLTASGWSNTFTLDM